MRYELTSLQYSSFTPLIVAHCVSSDVKTEHVVTGNVICRLLLAPLPLYCKIPCYLVTYYIVFNPVNNSKENVQNSTEDWKVIFTL